MAIKEKNQPVAEAPATTIGLPPLGARFNPKIDAELTKFMADNPEMTERYTKLVKENPEYAVRTMALRSMFRQQDIARQNERQMPQVEEWVSQQPGLRERIEEKIVTKNPIMRAAAFISEAFKAKGRIDLAPSRPNVGPGMSV
jgi:hypothetical protein